MFHPLSFQTPPLALSNGQIYADGIKTRRVISHHFAAVMMGAALVENSCLFNGR